MLNSLLYVSSQYHNILTFIRKALNLTVDFWGEIILLLSPSAADLSSPKAVVSIDGAFNTGGTQRVI